MTEAIKREMAAESAERRQRAAAHFARKRPALAARLSALAGEARDACDCPASRMPRGSACSRASDCPGDAFPMPERRERPDIVRPMGVA